MAIIEKIDKVKKVSGAAKPQKTIAIEEELKRVGPNKERFDTLLAEKQTKIQPDTTKIEPSRKNSPMEEIRRDQQHVIQDDARAPCRVDCTDARSDQQNG